MVVVPVVFVPVVKLIGLFVAKLMLNIIFDPEQLYSKALKKYCLHGSSPVIFTLFPLPL
ncbi:hypothetical protein DSECCO2_283190 [anaerobic digester metagenome]